MNELKNRGVSDVLIAVIDGLKGFQESINAVFPQTIVQTCIVHLIRHSMDFAFWKDRKALAGALKTIYRAKDADAANVALAAFDASHWGQKYPAIAQSWRRNWERVIQFFAFKEAVRSGSVLLCIMTSESCPFSGHWYPRSYLSAFLCPGCIQDVGLSRGPQLSQAMPPHSRRPACARKTHMSRQQRAPVFAYVHERHRQPVCARPSLTLGPERPSRVCSPVARRKRCGKAIRRPSTSNCRLSRRALLVCKKDRQHVHPVSKWLLHAYG